MMISEVAKRNPSTTTLEDVPNQNQLHILAPGDCTMLQGKLVLTHELLTPENRCSDEQVRSTTRLNKSKKTLRFNLSYTQALSLIREKACHFTRKKRLPLQRRTSEIIHLHCSHYRETPTEVTYVIPSGGTSEKTFSDST